MNKDKIIFTLTNYCLLVYIQFLYYILIPLLQSQVIQEIIKKRFSLNSKLKYHVQRIFPQYH